MEFTNLLALSPIGNEKIFFYGKDEDKQTGEDL